MRITGIFMGVLARLIASGDLPWLNERSLEIVAHNISVMGHMWTFRRWFLARHSNRIYSQSAACRVKK
ncbi:MAG: hypothetical protein JRE58_14850 [Deltaproteobacteria bacterium]|nr:hypothetical protein [Deltaproteobacteria bacterium]